MSINKFHHYIPLNSRRNEMIKFFMRIPETEDSRTPISQNKWLVSNVKKFLFLSFSDK